MKLLHLHLHGLIRSKDLELGRDADTGGQTLYVLELVKALASCDEVDQVDLVTRLIDDRKVSSDYSLPIENIAPGADILRIPFGPKRYFKKELLWPYLDDLVEKLTLQLKRSSKLPDWIHAHYADAGYVGALVSERLGIPFVFTGHSLGKEKKRRLLETSMTHEQIEKIYSITRRIEAEELALRKANYVITSTTQEVDTQYARYINFAPKRSQVIPPGVDMKRFNFEGEGVSNESPFVEEMLFPFLRNPSLPPLLAISRAVRRKNVPALVEAFGRSSTLRSRYNLILILGNRADSRQLDKQQRDVFQEIFELVDRYDLYGKIAYPKSHRRDQVPAIYRWAARKKGLFVNPSLTEPFGLTLLEAAACGLPTVATDDGGPSEILSKCGNGVLVDVSDLNLLRNALENASENKYLWRHWQANGLKGVQNHFSWNAHVSTYLALMQNHLQLVPPSSAEVIQLSGIRAS